MVRTRSPKSGVKTWRLSYLVRKKGLAAPNTSAHLIFSFLTVAEALEHCRLLGVLKFHLEDQIDPSARTH